MLAASLRREFNDAATLISGCGVIGGALTWVGARIWMVISRKEVDLERWVLDGRVVERSSGLSASSLIWCCDTIMSVGVSKARDTSRGGSKEPTGRDYAIYYGLGAAGVLLLGALAAVLDWSRFGFRLSVFAWVAVYVPLGVIVLRGRRAKPEAARP